MRISVLLLVLAGCAGGGGSATDTGSGNDTGSSTNNRPDILAGLGAEDCEDFDGTPYTGATSYFAGEYDISGETLSGKEYWMLIPNTQWAADGVTECIMVWDITGTSTDCTTGCTTQLAISAVFNPEASDCPQELEDIEGGDFSVTYDVSDAGGTATVNFTSSGNFLGSGTYEQDRVTWVSDYQCEIF